MIDFSVHTLAHRALLVILSITISFGTLFSQVETDTLSSIVVSQIRKENASQNAKYSPGTRVQKFTDIPQATSSNSLSDFLQKKTALYIKEYGRGMSSYLSIRGTSSSHTTIDWNGQSLSVPTMGQTDLSHIPLYFFDNMSVHIGGNSALYGNGSLSGNIQLQTTPQYKDGISGDITLKGGSFSTLFAGGTLRYGQNNIESRTSAYYSYAKNNYRFSNNTKIGFPHERLNNAAYNNWGLLQEFFKKFNDNSQLQLSVMHLEFDREIQPSVSNNDVESSFHSILDRNSKVSANYKGGANGKWFYTASAAYNHDYELYEEDVIEADRIMVGASGEFRTKKISVRGGTSVQYIKPNMDAYAAGTKEWRGEIYTLALWQPIEDLTLGGGVRGTFVTDMHIPVQPSFDIKYKILNPYREKSGNTDAAKAAQHMLSIRGSISKSAKTPTLNDRYWGGTTADLKPETGTTYELGADYDVLYGSWEINSYLTLYKSDVNDWIRWLPAGEIWRPQNVPEVGSNGLETGVGVTRKWTELKLSLNANYNYTQVEMRKSLFEKDPSIGKQMAYQPKHSFRANLQAEYRKLIAELAFSYTGKRTSTDIYDIMDAYSLLDLILQYKFKLWDEDFGITGEIKNILNVNYQNVRFYAMPGTNFALALRWNF